MERGLARVVKRGPDVVRTWVIGHRASVSAWCLLAVGALTAYHLFSDGDFSFLMTLGSLIGMFSFGMVLWKLETGSSCAGLSLNMVQCYVCVFACRLIAIIPYDGYLPYDRSGDWLYQTIESISLILAGSIAWLGRTRHRATYEAKNDLLPWWIFTLVGLALGVFIHPNLNGNTLTDISWVTALYLESLAVVPQLFMFQKTGKVQPFTSHFLAAQATSKFLSFIFWLASYSELNGPKSSINRFVGPWVFFLQLAQLLVMADFIYRYLRCLSTGRPMQLLVSDAV